MIWYYNPVGLLNKTMLGCGSRKQNHIHNVLEVQSSRLVNITGMAIVFGFLKSHLILGFIKQTFLKLYKQRSNIYMYLLLHMYLLINT